MARNTHNALGYKQKQIASKHSKNKLNRLRAISDLKNVIPDIICEGRAFQIDGGESASRSKQKLQIDVFVLKTSCRFYFQFNIRLLLVTTMATQCSHVSRPEGCHVASLILFLVAREHAQLSCLKSTVCACGKKDICRFVQPVPLMVTDGTESRNWA